MKKQFELLMYTGIMAGAVMTSCKSSDNVVMYDAQAQNQSKVYSASKGNASNGETNRVYTRNDQDGTVIYTAKTNTVETQPVQSVYKVPDMNQKTICPMVVVNPAQNYQDNSSASQYMPPIVDMTNARSNNVQTSGYYNQPAQPVQPQYNGYGYYNQAQAYNVPQPNKKVQSTSGRNRSLDNNLNNRPNSYTLTEDMYTPEYRSIVYNRQNNRSSYYQQPAQNGQNDPYAGLMTIENGNVVPYNSQPRIIQQQEYYVQPQQVVQPQVQYQQPQYQQSQPQVQQYVTQIETQQQQYYYPQAQAVVVDRDVYVNPQNPPVRQIEATSYPVTLYFKNGAKLAGTMIKIDEEVCLFRMVEGNVVNFATKDILKIEKR